MLKLYKKMNENKLIFILINVVFSVALILEDKLILTILAIIILTILCVILLDFLYKLIMLKHEIKNNIIEEKVIKIKNVDHIKRLVSSRSSFYNEYHGISISSSVSKYHYLYEKTVRSDDKFTLYRKISKLTKIKIIYYKKSKIIKEIKTNV